MDFHLVLLPDLQADIAAGIKNKEELSRSIREGIRSGIVATQKYFINGFGENVVGNDFPSATYIYGRGS